MFFNRLFNKRYPFLDWIQVEISSYCNASCIYCPHTAYKKNWLNRHLPIEVFYNLITAFKRTDLVYLQGWGEPFTHPQFFEMVRLAKKAGCMVGTTTNGTLLSKDSIEKLVTEELDIIGFSLTGVDERNDSIRKGTRIKKVLKCLEEIHRAKSKYGTDKPKIHIAYMLMRSGLDDLNRLPKFFGKTGAIQTVVSSLSLVTCPAMETESMLASGEKEYLDLQSRLLEVKEESAKQGADVHFHIVSPFHKSFNCSENSARATVIGSDGSVSPCVMKQIPLAGKNYFYFKGQRQKLQNLAFGNIYQDFLNSIWHRHDCKQFIRNYLRGEAPALCQNCLKQSIDNLSANELKVE